MRLTSSSRLRNAVGVIAVLTAGLRPSAQEPALVLTDAPSSAFSSESLRRAVASIPPPVAQAAPRAQTSDWSRVIDLNALNGIVLTTDSMVKVRRMFMFADDTGLVTINLNDRALSSEVRALLRTVVACCARRVGTIVLHGGIYESKGDQITVSSAGLFHRGFKVGALDELFERTPESSVHEISKSAGRRVGHAQAGALLGMLSGLGGGLLSCRGKSGECVQGVGGAMFGGAIVGAIVGAAWPSSDLVYARKTGA